MVRHPSPLGASVMLQGEMFGVSSVLGREEKRSPSSWRKSGLGGATRRSCSQAWNLSRPLLHTEELTGVLGGELENGEQALIGSVV